MQPNLNDRLVIGLASSALFDLSDSDAVFRELGEEKYREFQRENEKSPLNPGVAFPFIKRLLSINEIDPENPLVEVILLSKNDPDTGMRVIKSIEHHGLKMTRAVFLQGRNPHRYIPALSINLFLSANEQDVKLAIAGGYPAGQVLPSKCFDDEDDTELRVAFDFDGVIADDESESVYQNTHSLSEFHKHEMRNVHVTHNPGPLKIFLQKLSNIQLKEQCKKKEDPNYKEKVRISIVTARGAPAHERVINTMAKFAHPLEKVKLDILS